jgi:hypothetical protein
LTPRDGLEEFAYAGDNRLGIGAAVGGLKLGAASLLIRGHAPFTPQDAIGVVEKETGIDTDGDVVVEREVLAVLKALKAIDDDIA